MLPNIGKKKKKRRKRRNDDWKIPARNRRGYF